MVGLLGRLKMDTLQERINRIKSEIGDFEVIAKGSHGEGENAVKYFVVSKKPGRYPVRFIWFGGVLHVSGDYGPMVLEAGQPMEYYSRFGSVSHFLEKCHERIQHYEFDCDKWRHSIQELFNEKWKDTPEDSLELYDAQELLEDGLMCSDSVESSIWAREHGEDVLGIDWWDGFEDRTPKYWAIMIWSLASKFCGMEYNNE